MMLITTRPQPPRPAGLRLLVTDTPETARIPAVTPATAARLVQTGRAVAYVDETAADGRQWLHLRPAAGERRAGAHADGDNAQGGLGAATP